MKKIIKYIYRGYRFRYKVDVNEINYMIKNLKEGNVSVDIGANKGGYLYWMEKCVKPTGRVYAFEPQIKLFYYLEEISRLKKYDNVIVENMGLSSEEGEAVLFIPKTAKGDSPGARIDFLDNGTSFDELKIKLTTLDKYFFESKINVDFIKIDVEGHEKEVLLGGVNLLKSSKPKILMECENRHLKEGNIFDVFNILTDLGYEGYYFENKKLKSIKHFDINIHQKIENGRFWESKDYINNFVFEYQS